MTIKESRIKNHLTQADAAKLLGVSKRAVEEWEAGNRKPKKSESEICELYGIAGMLTREGLEALLAGEVSMEEMRNEYKIQTAKELSKWGAYGDTFSAILARVPESVFDALNGEQLAELIDSLQEAYNDGVDYGKVHGWRAPKCSKIKHFGTFSL